MGQTNTTALSVEILPPTFASPESMASGFSPTVRLMDFIDMAIVAVAPPSPPNGSPNSGILVVFHFYF